jgi:hypothetical protein
MVIGVLSGHKGGIGHHDHTPHRTHALRPRATPAGRIPRWRDPGRYRANPDVSIAITRRRAQPGFAGHAQLRLPTSALSRAMEPSRYDRPAQGSDPLRSPPTHRARHTEGGPRRSPSPSIERHAACRVVLWDQTEMTGHRAPCSFTDNSTSTEAGRAPADGSGRCAPTHLAPPETRQARFSILAAMHRTAGSAVAPEAFSTDAPSPAFRALPEADRAPDPCAGTKKVRVEWGSARGAGLRRRGVRRARSVGGRSLMSGPANGTNGWRMTSATTATARGSARRAGGRRFRERAQLVVGGVAECGADVVAEADVAGGRFGVACALGGAAVAVVLGGVAQVVVEAGAAEVALLVAQ